MAETPSSQHLTRAFEDSEQELKNNLPPWSEADFKQRLLTVFLYIAIYLPVVVLLGLVIGGYIIYMIFYIYPLVGDTDDRPELYYWHSDSEKTNAETRGWIFFALVTWCIFWILVSHYRALKTDPGQIPREREWDIPDDENDESSSESVVLIEKRKDGSIRTCARCTMRKPDRTHHCKQCERCNLKMDHHCNWIANCVGYFNYKYFFLIVFYGAIALAIFIGTFWETVVVVLNDSESSAALCFFVVLCYSLILMLGIAVIGFCIFHIRLMIQNYTTIEYCEKKKQKVQEYKVSPFDKGAWNNLKEALGKTWYWWFVPFNYRDQDEKGLHFGRK